MTNEQMLNAMIPGALKRLEDAGSHEYIGATAMVSASDLRVLLAHVAALKADAERYRWLRDQHWSESVMCVVSNPKSAIKLGHDAPSGGRLDAMIDAAMRQSAFSANGAEVLLAEAAERAAADMRAAMAAVEAEASAMSGALKQITESMGLGIGHTAAEIVAEIAELKQRLADSMRDMQALKADPALGEWVEWTGGKCPIADGVRHQVKFRDGSQSQICQDAPSWSWRNDGSEFDIIAYRIIP